jgi:hypothetical protein
MENRKKGDGAQCCGFFVSVATAEDLPPPRGGVLARVGGRGYGGDPAAAGGTGGGRAVPVEGRAPLTR